MPRIPTPHNNSLQLARLAAIEIHLASSPDGFNWTVNAAPIAYGSVPGLVETADGTLYIYYVDASHRRNP